ncbi:hypothetical protein V6N11_038202 [Hibiscus sabdariffa]|uniref:SHSP domain-containing protein n=1 Tax=Hibiscus sabdariffa TaxID=183260 RepID=A0ABR2SJD6_9ROSI
MVWINDPPGLGGDPNCPHLQDQRYNREDIKVGTRDGNIIQTKGEGIKEETLSHAEDKDNVWHVAERVEFSREIELSDNVKVEHIKAQVDKDSIPKPSNG